VVPAWGGTGLGWYRPITYYYGRLAACSSVVHIGYVKSPELVLQTDDRLTIIEG